MLKYSTYSGPQDPHESSPPVPVIPMESAYDALLVASRVVLVRMRVPVLRGVLAPAPAPAPAAATATPATAAASAIAPGASAIALILVAGGC